jgi:hypothetical protein
VVKNLFKPLWNKCEATDPYNIAGIICSDAVLKCIKKLIKTRYNEKCEDQIILSAVHKIVTDKMDPALIKPFKAVKIRVKKEKRLVDTSAPGSDYSSDILKNEQMVGVS